MVSGHSMSSNPKTRVWSLILKVMFINLILQFWKTICYESTRVLSNNSVKSELSWTRLQNVKSYEINISGWGTKTISPESDVLEVSDLRLGTEYKAKLKVVYTNILESNYSHTSIKTRKYKYWLSLLYVKLPSPERFQWNHLSTNRTQKMCMWAANVKIFCNWMYIFSCNKEMPCLRWRLYASIFRKLWVLNFQ